MSKVSREMCENSVKNVLKRARICKAKRDGNLSDIIFHI